MTSNLYTLRYRQGTIGVQSALITASSPKKAEELGQWWCNQRINTRFVRVEPAVIADEADMPTATPVETLSTASAAVRDNINESIDREFVGVSPGSTLPSLPKLNKK